MKPINADKRQTSEQVTKQNVFITAINISVFRKTRNGLRKKNEYNIAFFVSKPLKMNSVIKHTIVRLYVYKTKYSVKCQNNEQPFRVILEAGNVKGHRSIPGTFIVTVSVIITA